MRERLIAVLLGTTLVLALACGWLVREVRSLRAGVPMRGVPSDAEERRALMAELARNVDAFYDTHPDPEVGRVLGGRPGLYKGVDISTNAMGMREADYELPKPAGTLRIVLLGDSFVFGWRVEAQERLGARLAQFLRERLGADPPRVECLHLAIPSWNLETECVWLERQLDRLQPDLVFHVTYLNDFDDVAGVRGFGVQSMFAPAHPEHADGFVTGDHPNQALGFQASNYLALALDGEGVARARAAGDRVLELQRALAALRPAARYVLIANWGLVLPAFHRVLGARLEEAERLYLPEAFLGDPTVTLDPADIHWSPAGHERMARLCYALIVERDLLPGRALPPWPEAQADLRALSAAGEADAQGELAPAYASFVERIRSEIDLRALDLGQALQIYGGIDAEGLVSPYASLCLRRGSARSLELDGRALPDAVLEGTRVRVWLDELELASLTLVPDQPIRVRAPIPAALDGRGFLALRLESDDFVYRGPDLRRCAAWRIERAALVP